MSEFGSGSVHGEHGGGPHHTPAERMRPMATLGGVALAIIVVGAIVLLTTAALVWLYADAGRPLEPWLA